MGDPTASAALRDPADEPPSMEVSLVVEALGPPLLGGVSTAGDRSDALFAGISIDSRTIRREQLFVAIRGERHDGNAFAAAAVRAGAAGVVAEISPASEHPATVPWWRVEDGVNALQRLALLHRRRLPARVVCVTGSNGKTSTKEAIAAVLASRFRVCRTLGNQNNLVGLPLSLLRLRPEHEWGVFEIGTSRPGEIARLAAVAEPDVGVITNVSPSHLEGLASLEGVLHEKTDLAAALGSTGILVYGGDGELLHRAVQAFGCRKVSFGLETRNDVHPASWSLDAAGRAVFVLPDLGTFNLQLLGTAGILNALAAIAVGGLAGVAGEERRRGLEALLPLPLRLEVERSAGVTIVQDCYNANPESMLRGVETLRSMGSGGTRVAVLGAMRELGAEADLLHYQLGCELASEPLDLLVVFGEEALALARGYQAGTGAPLFFFRDRRDLVRFLQDRIRAPATVLFKASRGVALEDAAREYLTALEQGKDGGTKGRRNGGDRAAPGNGPHAAVGESAETARGDATPDGEGAERGGR